MMKRIKILDPPADTVTQSVEHRLDKPKAGVRIPVSVRLLHFFRCVHSSMLPWLIAGRFNFDMVLHKLIMLIQKRQKKFK